MNLNDLLTQYNQTYDIKDHTFIYLKTNCEFCNEITFTEKCGKTSKLDLVHSLLHIFTCYCGLNLNFYERQVVSSTNSQIYTSDYLELSCAERIIKSIII